MLEAQTQRAVAFGVVNLRTEVHVVFGLVMPANAENGP